MRCRHATYDQTQQVAESRDTFSDDPGDDPAGQSNAHPRSNRDQVALAHALRRVAEDTDIEVFETNMAVDHSGANNLDMSVVHCTKHTKQRGPSKTYRGNGNSISDLFHNRTSRSQCRRSNVIADIVVNDDSRDHIQHDFEDLQHAQGLGEVLRFLHLRNETKERDMRA